MHEPVKECLEDYLGPSTNRRSQPLADRHLSQCEDCRELLDGMRQQSALLRTLRSPREVEPGPEFYVGVLQRIEAERSSSIWNAFLNPFGRRLAYASAALLLTLGAYIYTSESIGETTTAAGPERALIDDGAHLNVDQQHQREALLVNLASYDDSGPAAAGDGTYQ